MINYYKTLEIPNFSSLIEIKKAHRKLSKKYHPDLNQGKKSFEEKFKEIQAAYEFLRDDVDRQRLDTYLRYGESNSINQNEQTEYNQAHEQTTRPRKTTYSQASDTTNHNKYTADNSKTSESARDYAVAYFIFSFIVILILSIVIGSITSDKEETNQVEEIYVDDVSENTELKKLLDSLSYEK